MRRSSCPPFALFLVLCVPLLAWADYAPSDCMNAAEIELADLVNAYRQESGLPSVPLSRTLTEIAQWHVADYRYAADELGVSGDQPDQDLHAWHGIPGAPYQTCRSATEHAQSSCMWNKPSEISEGVYSAIGFELAASGFDDVHTALEAWKASPSHNDFLLNRESWSSWDFNAMGVGVDETRGWFFLWFGTALDLQGATAPCAPGIESAILELAATPNPFNPQVTLSFELEHVARVTVAVHDVQGRVVRQFAAGSLPEGHHDVVWDGTDNAGLPAASGTYFVRVQADEAVQSIKVALLK